MVSDEFSHHWRSRTYTTAICTNWRCYLMPEFMHILITTAPMYGREERVKSLYFHIFSPSALEKALSMHSHSNMFEEKKTFCVKWCVHEQGVSERLEWGVGLCGDREKFHAFPSLGKWNRFLWFFLSSQKKKWKLWVNCMKNMKWKGENSCTWGWNFCEEGRNLRGGDNEKVSKASVSYENLQFSQLDQIEFYWAWGSEMKDENCLKILVVLKVCFTALLKCQ